MTDDPEVLAGQAIYRRRVLSSYDLVVLRLSNPLLWRCRTSRILRQYDLVGADHLELGVGTGYYLDRCAFPVPEPRITLLDLNAETLRYTAQRLARYRPDLVRANVLEPLPVPRHHFDSVALNYLLHCVPGDLNDKSVVLANAAAAAKPGGKVFGSTILSGGVRRSRPAEAVVRQDKAMGGFPQERHPPPGPPSPPRPPLPRHPP